MNKSRDFLLSSVLQISIFKFVTVILPAVILFAACDANQPGGTTVSDGQTDATSLSNSETDSESPETAPPETAPPKISPLINADELKALLDTDSSVKILEPSRDQEVFSAGHLPSAQFIHWIDDMTDPGNVSQYNNLQTKQFEGLMSRLGIENEDQVIIYDRLNSRLSTRLLWSFKLYGHEHVQILDGGFDAWNSKQFPISKDAVEVAASDYHVASTEEEILAKLDFVKSEFQNSETRLIDGRPPVQYSGEEFGRIFHTNEQHPRKGHIPGAVNIFWKDNFNEDGTFKSAEQLRELYRNAGVESDSTVITYCNEGLHAAPPWFVLHQLLGYEKVRLYDSSMAEWAKTDAPMEESK